MTVNGIFLSAAAATKEHKGDAQPAVGGENVGTEILDATCSPSSIKYPQDFELLHEARKKLEGMMDDFHKAFHPWKKPRTYRGIAGKTYLALAKAKKRTAKKVRRQLEHVRRDFGYLEAYMAEGYALPGRDMACT